MGIIMVAWLVLSFFNGGKKEMWGPHRHPPLIEKFFKLHLIKGDLRAAGDMSLLARLEMTLRELVCWRGGGRKKEQLRGCRWEGAE